MNNPFSNPAFSMAALTAAINILPNRYGRLEDLNLMPPKPVRQRQVVVEEMNGVLNLLPTLPPGSPGTVGVRGKRKLRSFVVPHIPHDDVVLPEEVQGIRAFGSETETETVAGVIARHLETMRNKHAITLEHLRMGALKGVILDADGSVQGDQGKGVSVCGEMAGDVSMTRLLLGLGLRSFSMHPAQILAVKQEVLRADTRRLRDWADQVLADEDPASRITMG